MTSNTHNDLRAGLREIFFVAAGGITDMANEEIDETIDVFITRLGAIKTELPRPFVGRIEGKGTAAANMRGYNEALDQVQTILDNEIKRLKGEV